MENKFSDKMIAKSSEELRDYITNKHRYELEAIDAAINELESRGEKLNEIELKTTENETIHRAEESKSNNSFSWIPQIIDEESARKAAKQGVWACLISSGLTLIYLIATFVTNSHKLLYPSVIDIAIYLILAWRISTMSKTAAITGLIYFILAIILHSVMYGFGPVSIKILLLIGFINSIRGTNAFHKYHDNKSA
jgi:hypothetical protein